MRTVNKTHFAGKELQVAKRRYSEHFRQVAVERLRGCENIVALQKELGVSRRQLYRWRDELDQRNPWWGNHPGKRRAASTLRKEVNHLKRVSGGEDAGTGFFQKCLAKVEAPTAGRAAGLARRHLRATPGSDAVARRLDDRAHVSTGPGEPGRLLPLVAGTTAVEAEMEVRSAIQQIAMEHRWRYGYRRISAETPTARYASEPQASSARIMREDNLLAVQPRQFVATTKSDHKLE